MEILPGSQKKAVGGESMRRCSNGRRAVKSSNKLLFSLLPTDLLSQVLSTDPVHFNSAINSNFSSNVVYSGHGIKVSNLPLGSKNNAVHNQSDHDFF